MELEVELGEKSPGLMQTRWASITLDGVPIFTELVYDTPQNKADRNIILLFGSRLRKLLEDE